MRFRRRPQDGPERARRQLGITGASVGLATQVHAAGAIGVDVVSAADARDLVMIAGPLDPTSTELGSVIGRGITVAVDGALCATLAEADMLVSQHSQRLAACAAVLFAPMFSDLQRRGGGLGPLTHLEVRHLRPTADRRRALDQGDAGVRSPRALFDLGVQPLAAALVLAASTPRAVSCSLQRDPSSGTDVSAEVSVTFDGGLSAIIHAGWHDADPIFDLQVSGPRGVVRVTLWPQPGLEVDGDDLAVEDALAKPDPLRDLGYIAQLTELLDDAATRRRPTVTAEFGRTVLEVIAGAYRSAAEGGSRIDLPIQDGRDLPVWSPVVP